MRMLNQAYEDAAAFKRFEEMLTDGTARAPSNPAIERAPGENRAAHRERLRRDQAKSKQLAKVRR